MQKEQTVTDKKTPRTQSHTLPYKEIGSYPKSPSMGTIISRFIDGLGYRYYWATEALRTVDLSFRPADGARTSLETLEHILDISGFILRIAQGAYNGVLSEKTEMSFEEVRHRTLHELKEASLLMAHISDDEFRSLEIKIQHGANKLHLPFWNLLNGPISDGLHHVGQVVSYRRASGNPINPSVDIFTGKNKE